VFCIYVAIGQKASTVAGVMKTLAENDAMAYTVDRSRFGLRSGPPAVLCPFCRSCHRGVLPGTGRPALIIYDDLSKQAVAYRKYPCCCAVLRAVKRILGTYSTAQPFARRAAKVIVDDGVAKNMNDLPDSIRHLVKGGGSLTALPIIETQAGTCPHISRPT